MSLFDRIERDTDTNEIERTNLFNTLITTERLDDTETTAFCANAEKGYIRQVAILNLLINIAFYDFIAPGKGGRDSQKTGFTVTLTDGEIFKTNERYGINIKDYSISVPTEGKDRVLRRIETIPTAVVAEFSIKKNGLRLEQIFFSNDLPRRSREGGGTARGGGTGSGTGGGEG